MPYTFHSGEGYESGEAKVVTRDASTEVIVLAGPQDSGKTTFLLSLYHTFLAREDYGVRFSGSLTLRGFENRAHLLRIASHAPHADVLHTSGEHSDYLHLQVTSQDGGPRRDVLFTDWAGEVFERATDYGEECRSLTVLRRADRIAVFINGEDLMSEKTRYNALERGTTFIRRVKTEAMLRSTTMVDFVITKLDLLRSGVTREVAKSIREQFELDLPAQLEIDPDRITVSTVCVKPDPQLQSGLKRGLGMGNVVRGWFAGAPAYVPPITLVDSPSERLFDRFRG